MTPVMNVVKPKDFSRLLKENKLPGTLLFIGEEVLLMDRAFHLIKERLLGEGWELNWAVLEGKKATPEELAEALATVPFASPRKVVVLKEILDFWKTWRQSHGDRLAAILTHHPQHTLLILQHVGTLEDKSKKGKNPLDHLLEVFQDPSTLVVNFSGSREELEKWVKKQLKKEGIAPDQGVVNWLLDVSQEKMALLEAELEKFILWGRKGEDIERPPTLWDVPAMIYRGDPRLITHLKSLMAERGVNYFYRIVSSSITRLVAALQAVEEGVSIQEAVAKASPFSKDRKALAQALKGYTLAEATQLLELAMETEIALKSGARRPDKDLERLMIRLVGRRGRRAG